jgi:hypothetical protein
MKYKRRALLHESEMKFQSTYSGAVHTISIAIEIHNTEPAYKSITDKDNYEETCTIFPSV